MRAITLYAAALGAALCLAGCAGSVNYERYTLSSACTAQAFSNPYQLRVQLLDSLDDGGIVMQTGAHTLIAAKSHRWALPLADELTVIINNSLLNADADGRLKAYLEDKELSVLCTDFQGISTGDAKVSLLFTLKDSSGRELAVSAHSAVTPLHADGYSALCESLLQLTEKLTAEFIEERLKPLAA